MLRRRRKLAPLPPPVYITLAEVQARKLRVNFDVLVPADKQRVCARAIRQFDDLPARVRHAINYARRCRNYLSLAVNLIDIGYSEQQVVDAIHAADGVS